MRRTYPGDTLVVARGVAEALPFADESFDLVWIRDVLVHIESLRPAFAEVRRVLRPGGGALVFHVFATPLLEPARGRAAVEWGRGDADECRSGGVSARGR